MGLRWLALLLVGLILAIPTAAHAEDEHCRASAEQGCLTGTLDTGEEQLEGIDILITPVDDKGAPIVGAEPTTATTDSSGRWSFAFTEPGRFQVEIVEDSLPDGVSALPSKSKLLKGPGKSVIVNGTLGGGHRACR